jgi:hypothetical protein
LQEIQHKTCREIWPRLIGYLAIECLYVAFMANHAPQGVKWAAFHGQRIFNAIEYLRLNGYLSAYGYSVWTSCIDCDLKLDSWKENIYISFSALKLWPYILFNEFGGKGFLFSYGHVIDKIVLGTTSALLCELILKETRYRSRISRFWLGSALFLLFATAPWTYKMMIAAWPEIWFVLFACMAYHALLSEKFFAAGVAFFVACVMHYQWGVVAGTAILITSALAKKFSEDELFGKYIPMFPKKMLGATISFGLAAIAAMQEIVLRAYVKTQLGSTDGSTLLFRIGISGEDIHNGGILGALQFLGGIRITNCLKGFEEGISALTLDAKIATFNCGLSVAGTALVSVIAVFGLTPFFRIYQNIRPFFFLATLCTVVFLSILQQSASAHLLGYSYVFSLIFVAGAAGLIEGFYRRSNSDTISIVALTPLVLAVGILFVHISMLGKV